MRTIEIDFEVYKQLTLRRASEDVTPNDVIRELLGLPNEGKNTQKPQEKNKKTWSTKGVSFPHGTHFRADYKGQTYNAVVENGSLLLNGKNYTSPSSAAISITGNSVNGWIFWECKMPGESSWHLIKKYRNI